MKQFLAILVVVASTVACKADIDWPRFMTALAATETGGEKNPDAAIGDGTTARGKYQIHEDYWKDACEFDKTLASGTYQDCHKPEYAARVVKAYLSRYGKAAIAKGDVSTLAAIHNGGPNGPKKDATKGYVRKFLKNWKAA